MIKLVLPNVHGSRRHSFQQRDKMRNKDGQRKTVSKRQRQKEKERQRITSLRCNSKRQ